MPDRHAGLPRAFDLTRLGYFLDFALVPLAVAALIMLGYRWGLGTGATAAGIVAGLLAWSLAEYWIHRAVFHSRIGFQSMHEMHHALPKDLIGIASWATFAGFALVWLSSAGLVGAGAGSVMTAGFLLGYLIYCSVHVAIHHRAARGLGRYGALMLALHQGHHRGGRGNFGVSSPLWDIVFGTYQPQGGASMGWLARAVRTAVPIAFGIAAAVAVLGAGLQGLVASKLGTICTAAYCEPRR